MSLQHVIQFCYSPHRLEDQKIFLNIQTENVFENPVLVLARQVSMFVPMMFPVIIAGAGRKATYLYPILFCLNIVFSLVSSNTKTLPISIPLHYGLNGNNCHVLTLRLLHSFQMLGRVGISLPHSHAVSKWNAESWIGDVNAFGVGIDINPKR